MITIEHNNDENERCEEFITHSRRGGEEKKVKTKTHLNSTALSDI